MKDTDYALIATAYQNAVRIYAATSTNLVEEARKIHETWPTATAAFGRFLTISSMMGLMYKQDERLTLKIEGDGPIKKMIVETNSLGQVKGDITNPNVYLKYEDGPKKGKLHVGKAIGNGFLHVTKDLNMQHLFSSSSPLQSGELGDDFSYYFATSEQTPTSVGVGVLVNIDKTVLASGGYILQLMPNTSETVIQQIETLIKKMPPVSTLIKDGKTPEDIIAYLSNDTYKILDKKEISYVCDCSKERFYKALSTLDKNTIQTMVDEDHGAEIVCHFCHKHYHFTEEELLQLIK